MMVELGVRADHLLINELAILIHAGSLFAWPDMLDHDFFVLQCTNAYPDRRRQSRYPLKFV